ncbi:MAG: apolipoprotein N-acyltransferase [Verrucomicrobiaceae bacterium]|nr:apolipoprotein N-acyltransferase [Verrucomicrobiaceae bacterium]
MPIKSSRKAAKKTSPPTAPPRSLRSAASRYWPEAAALLSGVLLALCYPWWDYGGLIWFWSAPLLTALWFSPPRKPGRARWKRGFFLGFLTGFAFFLIDVRFITEISHVAGTVWAGLGALLAFACYLALYFAVFGAFAATVGRWVPLAPGEGKGNLFGQSFSLIRVAFLNGAAWCGLEWLRGFLFTGFGWNGLGVALKNQLLLVQFADVIGITGYSFVLLFVGILVYGTAVRLAREIRDRRRLRPHFDFALGVVVIMGLLLYGNAALLRRPSETVDLRARILQLNVSLEDKWSDDLRLRQKILFEYRDLTRTFVETAPLDLMIWPETAIPGQFSAPWVQEYFNDHILKGDDFHLITGLEDNSLDHREVYNTLTLLQGDTESYQMHKKIHLVPLGEYLPFRGRFPVFEWIAGGIIERDFTPGDSYEPLAMEKDGHSIGIIPLICFEDTVPRHARKFIRNGPQIMVNVTNDGWFYDSAESTHHFYNALFRCIELRRPMIRAANTGVSGFIDEWGSLYDREGRSRQPRILRDAESGSTYIRGSLPATITVDLHPPMSFYARHGDVFSVGMGCFALLATMLAGVKRRSRRPS